MVEPGVAPSPSSEPDSRAVRASPDEMNSLAHPQQKQLGEESPGHDADSRADERENHLYHRTGSSHGRIGACQTYRLC